jgi:taurine dioxygenase
MMEITELSPAGGIRIGGLDLSHPLSAETEAEITRLFDSIGLLVISDQKLSKQQLVDAGRLFGGVDFSPPANAGDPQVRGLSIISTRGAEGNIEPDPKDADKLLGDITWHSDQAYVTAPNRGKLLYAVDVPAEGGTTGFIDGVRTYEALPAAMKQRIAGLSVIQSYDRAEEVIARNRGFRYNGEKALAAKRFRDTAYPVALVHPITGKTALNVPPLWAAGIVGMPQDEARALLDELIAHILEPRFAYWHRYLPGDIAVWDNWRFIHAAGGTPSRFVRTLWSVVLNGGPQIGVEMAAA